jgi:hypothetical protein
MMMQAATAQQQPQGAARQIAAAPNPRHHDAGQVIISVLYFF